MEEKNANTCSRSEKNSATPGMRIARRNDAVEKKELLQLGAQPQFMHENQDVHHNQGRPSWLDSAMQECRRGWAARFSPEG